jgi:hypothetical protein
MWGIEMLAIVRIKTTKGNDGLWNYIKENHAELEAKFDNCVEIMYMTKREKYEDTSLFIESGSPDCFGDFITKVIAHIPNVDEIWMFNVMNMKFYYIPNVLLEDWKRYSITIRTPPNRFEETYYELSKLIPTVNAAPVFVAYTFHMYGDSLKFSIVAKDSDAANEFVEKNINSLPDVHTTHITKIERQLRLTSPESWKIFIKSHLLSKESVTPPKGASGLFQKVPSN